VRWRLAGLQTMIAKPLPALIAWDDTRAFPGRMPLALRGLRPRGFAWLELAGVERRLHEWLGATAGVPLRIINGKPAGLRAAAIALEYGDEIVIR